MLCHALSVKTLIGKRLSGSAPTNPSNIKKSLPDTCCFILSKILSNFSVDMGWFTLPQSTRLFVISSSTMNLSSGERPVNLPVLTDNAPEFDNSPSFL